MAKTFKLNVSFPMTLKVSTDTVNEFLEARKDAREIIASGKVLKGESKFRVELLASDKEDDEVLKIIFRTGIREVIRKDLIKETCGNESTGSVGDTLVVFEAAPKRTCQDCIVTDCQRPYSRGENVGCDDKRTGVREPINVPIPQTCGERIVSGWDAGDI